MYILSMALHNGCTPLVTHNPNGWGTTRNPSRIAKTPSGGLARRGETTMNLSQDLRRTIEDEIVDGRLALGSRLDEVQLATRFGVSRTPIREALLQLAVSGLVETKPRGAPS